jgi:membrane protease YdiL (CAAX protease family)
MTDRRRRVVVVITLVVGATLLGLSLATRPGDPLFYPLLLAVAATWVIGGRLSGPLRLGRTGAGRRPVLAPFVIGLAAGLAFVVGGLILRLIPDLRDPVVDVLDHARRGNPVLVGLLALVNGLAEEVFFRGAVYAAFERRAVLGTTAVYVLVTAATGNPMLVLAGVIMGTLFAWQRRLSGGVLAPAITHLTWTLVVIVGLPLAVGG